MNDMNTTLLAAGLARGVAGWLHRLRGSDARIPWAVPGCHGHLILRKSTQSLAGAVYLSLLDANESAPNVGAVWVALVVGWTRGGADVLGRWPSLRRSRWAVVMRFWLTMLRILVLVDRRVCC